MTLSVHVSPETDAWLERQAVTEGVTKAACAARILERAVHRKPATARQGLGLDHRAYLTAFVQESFLSGVDALSERQPTMERAPEGPKA